MKAMNYIKQILALLLLAGCGLYTSCTDEKAGYGPNPETDGMTLSISLPDPIRINPQSRAGMEDFNKIHNLNIVIADGEGDNARVKKILYLDGSLPDDEIEPGITVTMIYGEDIPAIHFDAERYPGKNIYVLANWGKALTTDEIPDVASLKSLKQTTSNQVGASGVPIGAMMFGKAESGTDGNHGMNHQGARMIARLLRTTAMVTVAIDGTALNEYVHITPTQVTLCNVPKACSVASENRVTADECVANGESKAAGTMWLKSITKGEKTGKHFSTTAYNEDGVEPIFLFENIHGEDFGDKSVTEENQKLKRPAGTGTTTADIEAATKNCSYLKVEAEYNYTRPGHEISGSVAFKLFLGENITDNFDVKRNHYYQVTLNLSGMVVTEDGHSLNPDGTLTINDSDASWRIDSKLDKVTILNGDVNLNASGDFFFLQLAGQENVEWKVTGSSRDNQFLHIYSEDGNYWGSPTSIGVSGKNIPKDGILIYSDEWYPDETGNSVSQSLTITLEIKESGSWKQVKSITVTQYDPIQVTLPSSANDLPEGLKDFAGRKMYIDRIDRKAMPWGFSGVSFDMTHGTNGFENAFNLIDENGSYHTQALTYTPWGNGNGGSAMVHAICLNNFTSSAPSETPEQLINNKDLPNAAELRSRYEDYNNYIWTIPTIAGWQVIEKFAKEEIEASGFPIYSFNEYWTSNAVTKEDKVNNDPNGDKYAYYYQYGAGFDSIQEGDPYPYYSLREQPKLYRCISVSKQ